MTNNHKDHADVKIHPPVLTALHILTAFVLNWLLPIPSLFTKALPLIGGLFVLLGVALAFGAVRELARARTTIDPHGSVSAIVTSGPYRFSRNPIYVGFVCTLIGFPLAWGTVWGIFLVSVFMWLMVRLVIQHEEAYLEKKFGDQYTGYKSRVRRWL